MSIEEAERFIVEQIAKRFGIDPDKLTRDYPKPNEQSTVVNSE